MPYATISDLPEEQVDQYSTHQKHAFLAIQQRARSVRRRGPRLRRRACCSAADAEDRSGREAIGLTQRPGRYSGGQMSYAVKSTQTRSRVLGMFISRALPISVGGSARSSHHALSDWYPY